MLSEAEIAQHTQQGIAGTDQRGLDRYVVGDVNAIAGNASRADIGAYEVQGLNLVVDTLDDESDGDYSLGDLSLREAIERSNTFESVDTITFDPTLFGTQQTIALTSQLPTITDALTITGPGQTLLTLDAGHGTDNLPGTGDGFRIFNIDDGIYGNEIDVLLSGLTLTGGDVAGGDFSGRGGAIFNRENLSVTNSTLSGNSAFIDGGGVSNSVGKLTLVTTTISGNTAGFNGGGVHNSGDGYYPVLTIVESTISGNMAGFRGGGVYNHWETNITGSTISSNSAVFGGGFFSDNYGATANLTSSTVSGNSASSLGGGIYNRSTANVTSTTINGNAASYGGGIYNLIGTATLNNTIVGNSLAGGDILINSGIVSGSYNLIEDGSGGAGLLNTISGDPVLGPLADNGGPTLTTRSCPAARPSMRGIQI